MFIALDMKVKKSTCWTEEFLASRRKKERSRADINESGLFD
jgi:hypothetical protein